ncbi:MAG: hypothetical protein EXR72_00345 [Myxococcales bacterium]|nr:hypothetical protein [Myxococcales bacterium]
MKIFAALLFVLASGCTSAPADRTLPEGEARALLIDRNWIDRLPEGHGDRLHVFRFVPRMGGGVYQDRTLFAGQFELFTFEHTGDEIRFRLPHAGERKTVRYRIETLAPDQAHGPLDLRLTLEGSPRGPSVYYGGRTEKGDLDASLEALSRG